MTRNAAQRMVKSEMSAKEQIELCRAQERRIPRLQLYTAAIKGLQTDWRDRDPGKYGATWFFVRSFQKEKTSAKLSKVVNCEGFWIESFTDDPSQAALGRPAERDFWTRKTPPPTPIPLGQWSDVMTTPCPSCGKDAIVVGAYDQTDDDQYGDDTWELTICVLCQECLEVHELAKRSYGHRFCSFCADGQLLAAE